MLYFSNFCFDTQHQILYQDNQVVVLSANQAKLLALFLDNPSKLLSKDDIFNHVWPRKIMTEQVVFQTISQLRAILGEGSIKTFPKRGYQWQLLTSVELSNKAPNGSNKKHTLFRRILYSLVACLALVVSGIWFNDALVGKQQIPNTAQSFVNWRSMPFSSRSDTIPKRELDALNANLAQHILPVNKAYLEANRPLIGVWQFFASPYVVYKKWLKGEAEVLFSGLIYDYQTNAQQSPQLVLEYLAQGQSRQWRGYVQASSLPALWQQVYQALQPLQASNYLNLASEAAASAELALLASQFPNNLAVLQQLITRQIEQGDYDAADAQVANLKVLAQRLSQPAYIAYAYWLKGELLFKLEQHGLALQQLEQAQQQLDQIGLLAMQSEVSKSQAEVIAIEKDFAQIQNYLFRSASQARIANRPTQEVRAYTLLSIRASKLKLNKEKYEYLRQAETLINDYQLDASHKMLTDYHWALFAEQKADKITYYNRVLSRPVTPNNFWVFTSVSEQRIHYAIEDKDWALAKSIANKVGEPARQSFLLAQIYVANQQTELAIQHAENAFNLARTQGIDWIGLDMALMLLELNKNDENPALVMLCKRFINNTASSWWVAKHQLHLEKVGIIVNPYPESP
ncbi:hypothetical protein PSECIP111854_00631 [Pseudoalteromonas sp. CIP111854]|uniref:OmpR/PhoB-type domain-containing protein n=1 Tax=Pseudoalteromonas holothuriae TaxID=2963714 RepID=A0A9W4QSB2_9GAMM|nr:winged helix-turn-helix domain-containing protein [Pseudoalteromonas sp. CIP111854]CAH9050923.1 hypothetical protein PSECIP111854_00631 [Pseudoalteromonas sp. CIP111854]